MAATDQLTRPILMRKEGRGYGRCDYERFDNVTTSHVNAGRGKIGEVEVDCRFFFTKSRWGYLGSDYGSTKTPGGIIYLDLDFHQPSDCRLRAASVQVTLTDQEGDRPRSGPRMNQTMRPVKFTSHYGPRHMRGAERPMHQRRVKHLTPHIEVMGQGAGGLGVSSEKTLITTSRWNFSGHLGSTKGSNWDNKLKWVLEENFLEDQSHHSNVIHTGFALEHNATRFFMTVEVTGKLVRTRDQIRQSLKFRDEEKAVTIKFEWKNGYSCPALLDNIARDLHLAMEHQNKCSVPAEIPDALPVSFSQTAASSSSGPWAGQGPPAIPQAALGAGIQPVQIDAQIGILGMLDSSHPPPEPTDQMMLQAAGLTPITVSPLSPTSTQTFGAGLQSQTTSTSTTDTRRGRSRSYQPSHLSTATTLLEEGDGQKGNQLIDTELLIVLQWFGKMSLLLIGLIAGSFGFPLDETRATAAMRRIVEMKMRGSTKMLELPTKSAEEPGEDTLYSPSLVSSLAGNKGHEGFDMKFREAGETESLFGAPPSMCSASTEY